MLKKQQLFNQGENTFVQAGADFQDKLKVKKHQGFVDFLKKVLIKKKIKLESFLTEIIKYIFIIKNYLLFNPKLKVMQNII